jgi:hypothetical protein
MENNKLEAWGDYVEKYSKRQKQLHKELANRKLMEMELENTISDMKNNEWMKGKPITDKEINELKKQFKNNTIQTQPDLIWTKLKPNKIWWTETKLWAVSSIFFITFLTLGWFYPMIALAICGLALGAVFLYMLIWAGTILLKDILGLDDK